MFGIGHEQLTQGGKATLDSGGHLGQLLFGAGMDLSKLRQFQKSLESEMSQLFKRTGEKPTINRA